MTESSVYEGEPRSDTGPFSIVPLWLLTELRETPRSAGSALLVYVALAEWADYSTGEAWPSHRTIGDRCGLGLTAVKSACGLLRSVGALRWEKRRRDDGSPDTNRYVVVRARPTSVAEATHPTVGSTTDPSVAETATNETHLNETQRNETLALVVAGPAFDDWYGRYPKKQGKAEARKRWGKMSDDERVAAVEALASVEAKAEREGTKYVPMASTWLNQRRWEDEPYAGPEVAADTRANRSRAAIAGMMRGAS
jgi:hypothetical protein